VAAPMPEGDRPAVDQTLSQPLGLRKPRYGTRVRLTRGTKPRSAEAISRLSVFAQVTALISPVGICTCQVHPLGRDNRDLTWADARRPPRSSADSGLGGHRRDTACQRPALTGAPFTYIDPEQARLIGLGRSPTSAWHSENRWSERERTGARKRPTGVPRYARIGDQRDLAPAWRRSSRRGPRCCAGPDADIQMARAGRPGEKRVLRVHPVARAPTAWRRQCSVTG